MENYTSSVERIHVNMTSLSILNIKIILFRNAIHEEMDSMDVEKG
jgi:hypothetical protein